LKIFPAIVAGKDAEAQRDEAALEEGKDH